MTALELIAAVESAGGRLTVTPEGKLRAVAPDQLIDELRQRREEIIALLEDVVLIPVACTCSRYPFPHIHSDADRLAGARKWNEVASPRWRIQ
jgi:hypothetical protein